MSLIERLRDLQSKKQEEEFKKRQEEQRRTNKEAEQKTRETRLVEDREKTLLKYTSENLAPLLQEVDKEWFKDEKGKREINTHILNNGWFYRNEIPKVRTCLSEDRGYSHFSLSLELNENGEVTVIAGISTNIAKTNVKNKEARQEIEDAIISALANPKLCYWTNEPPGDLCGHCDPHNDWPY